MISFSLLLLLLLHTCCAHKDVREAHEVAAGAIPTSMHVPLGHVEEALTLDADDFKLLFKHDMPSNDQLLIVYCRHVCNKPCFIFLAAHFTPHALRFVHPIL